MAKPYRTHADQFYKLRLEGWSNSDIADHFNCSQSGVRGGISEYRKHLRLSTLPSTVKRVIPLPHQPPDNPKIKPKKINQRHRGLAIRNLTYRDNDADRFWKRYSDLKRQKRFINIWFPTDKHMPFHDPDAIALDLQIINDIGADIIIHGSDIFDFPTISKHEPDYELANHPQFDDVLYQIQDSYTTDTTNLLDIAPDAIMPFIFGNHDTRFIELAIASDNPRTLLSQFVNLIKHDGHVQYLGLTQELLLDSLFIRHDGGAGQNVAKLMTTKDNSVHHLAGHTHRHDAYVHVSKRNISHSIVSGCRCQLIPHYFTKRGKHTTNWSQSLILMVLDTHTGNVNPVPFYYNRDDTHIYTTNGTDTYYEPITSTDDTALDFG